MPAVPPPAKVLVSGASGFIGAHVVRAFLARGYSVRGAVRSPSKGDYLVKLFEKDYPGKFEYVIVRDIAEPGVFDEAVKGVDAIAHTASPVEFSGPEDHPDKLIVPAVNGTVGILKSAAAHGESVKRVVVTSSFAALLEPHDGPYEYSEDDWNEFSIAQTALHACAAEGFHKYRASKSLAEKALWDFIKNDNTKFDAATVNPPFVYGPVIHDVQSLDGLNLSVGKLWKLLQTAPTEEVIYDGNNIDVRDVAEAHVDAIARPDIGGHRLVIGRGPLAHQDFLDAYHSLPKDSIPTLPFDVPVGTPHAADAHRDEWVRISKRSQELLGREFILLAQQIKDLLWSLKNKGLF